jgi:hypothetical protein
VTVILGEVVSIGITMATYTTTESTIPSVRLIGAITKTVVGIMNAAMRYIQAEGRNTSRNVVIPLFDH